MRVSLHTPSTTGAEKEAASLQCAEIVLCRKFTVHFFLKNITPKRIPSSGLDATLELLHPTQHFWCLTRTSALFLMTVRKLKQITQLFYCTVTSL